MIFFYYPFDENAEMKVTLKKGAFFTGIYSHFEVITIDEEVLSLHYYHLPDHHIEYLVSKDYAVQKNLVAVQEKNVSAVDLFEEIGGDRYSDNNKLQKQTFWPIDIEKKINQSAVKKLLKKINEETPTKLELQEAIITGNYEAIQLLYTTSRDLFQIEDDYAQLFYDWIFITVKHNRLEILQWFFKHPDVCQREENAKAEILVEASKKGNKAVIELLLNSGYDINRSSIFKTDKAEYATDPMEAIVERGLVDVAHFIQDQGSLEMTPERYFSLMGQMRNTLLSDFLFDVIPTSNEQEYFNLGLLHASHIDNDLIEFYLEKGADINFIDKNGMTAICYALSYSEESSLETLIKHGANPDLGKVQDQTPKEYAQSLSSNPKILEILNS
ncbi:MAG: hypothetical protein JKY54_15910 [Flavobacteriales bacterium]|nr:hypothetical protein [Flavobacteriales bacterium]